MSFWGIGFVVGLPIVMGLCAGKDKSDWIVLGGQVPASYSRLFYIFFWVMIIGSTLYLIYQISAAWLMGSHGESYWIFNFDNAVRMELAWRVHYAETYPPGLLTVPSAEGTHYHFGSVALGSFFSKIFQGDAGTAYLRLTTPVILIPTVLTPPLLIYARTRSHVLSVIPLLIMSVHFAGGIDLRDIVEFGLEVVNLGIGIAQGNGAIIRDVFVMRELHGAQTFGNLVLDGAYVSILAFSALAMAGIIGLRRNTFGLMMAGLAPIALFMNTRLGAGLVVLVGASLLMAASREKIGSAVILVASICLCVVVYFLFGPEFGLKFPRGNISLSINPEATVSIKKTTYIVLAAMSMLLALMVVAPNVAGEKNGHHVLTFEQSLLITGILTVLGLAVAQPLINGEYNIYEHQVKEYLEPTVVLWGIATFLLLTSLRDNRRGFDSESTASTDLFQKVRTSVAGLILVMGTGWGVLDGYHSGVQALKLWVWSESGHDAVNFIDYKRCLGAAGPDPLLATNNVTYPGANYHRSRQFVGHLHIQGNRRSLYATSTGLALLGEVDASINEIRSHFKELGATHLLIDKGRPWASSLNEHFIYSNDTCALIDVERLPAG